MPYSVSGYAGKSDLDEAYADMLVDCTEDYIRSAVVPIFRAKSDEEKVYNAV